MNCPKCHLGRIKKITLTKFHLTGSFCEYCCTFWFEDELIKSTNGHSIYSFVKDDMEYSVTEIETPETKSVLYPKIK